MLNKEPVWSSYVEPPFSAGGVTRVNSALVPWHLYKVSRRAWVTVRKCRYWNFFFFVWFLHILGVCPGMIKKGIVVCCHKLVVHRSLYCELVAWNSFNKCDFCFAK